MHILLRNKYFLIVLFFSFLAAFALLHSGLPPTHDGEYHVIRFYEFDKVLRDGNLFPRWAPDLNHGYGIPLFNFVYPLPNYFSSLVHFFGVSFIDSFKFNLFMAMLLAGIFFYLWTKQLFNEKAAAVGSIFYIFSPYSFVDVYIRGSVGEVWALAFFPALLWTLTQLIYKNKSNFLPYSMLLLGLLIFAHNILSLMFFPLAFLYGLLLVYLKSEKREMIAKLLLVNLFGLGLSAVFWLPAIAETKYTVGLQIFDFKRNFGDFFLLLIPSWGSGFFGGSLADQMSIQIGIANLLAVILGIYAFFKLVKSKDSRAKIVLFFIITFLFCVFLILPISLPIWEKVPLMNYFQFPWRFLSLVILSCSFLAASFVSTLSKSKSLLISFLLILISVGLTFGYAHPAYFMQRSDSYYTTRPNFIDGTNSIGNVFNTIWFKPKSSRPTSKIENSPSIEIKNQEIKSTNYKFTLSATKNSSLTVNTAYFPGWQARIDSLSIPISKTSDGIMAVNIPKGEHKLEIAFKDTPIRFFANFLSLASAMVILIMLFKKWYSKRYESR